MKLLSKQGNITSYLGEVFQVDRNSSLSLFVSSEKCKAIEGSGLPSTVKCAKSQLMAEEDCCGKTHSNPLNEDSLQDSDVQSAGLPIIFKLNYLPKQISKKEVINKLEKFGKIKNFEFIIKDKEPQEHDQPESEDNFKIAEFTFVDLDAEVVFSKVKRIRIKGLQVKISQKLSNSTSKTFPSSRECQEDLSLIDHSRKPTCKAYFNCRSHMKKDASLLFYNYYWRFPASPN